MYRKYKEHKDSEYETIVRRQANESRIVADQEGISIPKTLEDYVAPSRAGASGNKNDKRNYETLSSIEDDYAAMDVSYLFKKKINKQIFFLFYLILRRMKMIL